MNERIKLLSIQAKDHATHLDKIGVDASFEDIFNAKFAELIVQECCSKLVEQGESWEEFARNPPHGQERNATMALFAAYRLKEDAVSDLKEHFGVEQWN